jgi:hypothetical protein
MTMSHTPASAPTSFHPGAGQPAPVQHFGVYLGRVSGSRGDGWVKVRVPQVLGTAESDWARPMGMDSLVFPPADTELPHWPVHGKVVFYGGTGGPNVGDLVMVMFQGGDVRLPVYALTSQKVA